MWKDINTSWKQNSHTEQPQLTSSYRKRPRQQRLTSSAALYQEEFGFATEVSTVLVSEVFDHIPYGHWLTISSQDLLMLPMTHQAYHQAFMLLQQFISGYIWQNSQAILQPVQAKILTRSYHDYVTSSVTSSLICTDSMTAEPCYSVTVQFTAVAYRSFRYTCSS